MYLAVVPDRDTVLRFVEARRQGGVTVIVSMDPLVPESGGRLIIGPGQDVPVIEAALYTVGLCIPEKPSCDGSFLIGPLVPDIGFTVKARETVTFQVQVGWLYRKLTASELEGLVIDALQTQYPGYSMGYEADPIRIIPQSDGGRRVALALYRDLPVPKRERKE